MNLLFLRGRASAHAMETSSSSSSSGTPSPAHSQAQTSMTEDLPTDERQSTSPLQLPSPISPLALFPEEYHDDDDNEDGELHIASSLDLTALTPSSNEYETSNSTEQKDPSHESPTKIEGDPDRQPGSILSENKAFTPIDVAVYEKIHTALVAPQADTDTHPSPAGPEAASSSSKMTSLRERLHGLKTALAVAEKQLQLYTCGHHRECGKYEGE